MTWYSRSVSSYVFGISIPLVLHSNPETRTAIVYPRVVAWRQLPISLNKLADSSHNTLADFFDSLATGFLVEIVEHERFAEGHGDDILCYNVFSMSMHESERWIEWESDDPESLFAELVKEHAREAGRILTIGCDVGALSDVMMNGVVSLELSRLVTNKAGGLGDRCYVMGDTRSLPFVDRAFDLICWCPIPGEAMQSAFQECARVLGVGGTLLGLMIGETHHIETQEIFGRGVGWPPAKPVRFAIPDAMRAVGLEVSFLAEYFGVSFYPDIQSFATEAASIIPDFDPGKDAALLREVQRKLTRKRGISNTEHVAVYAALKRA